MGQVGTLNCGLRADPPISDEKTFIANSLGASIQFRGVGATGNRDSDWNGHDGIPLNKLWDSQTDVLGSGAFLAAGGGTKLQHLVYVTGRLYRLGCSHPRCSIIS